MFNTEMTREALGVPSALKLNVAGVGENDALLLEIETAGDNGVAQVGPTPLMVTLFEPNTTHAVVRCAMAIFCA